jgi:hypothetical protein
MISCQGQLLLVMLLTLRLAKRPVNQQMMLRHARCHAQ